MQRSMLKHHQYVKERLQSFDAANAHEKQEFQKMLLRLEFDTSQDLLQDQNALFSLFYRPWKIRNN